MIQSADTRRERERDKRWAGRASESGNTEARKSDLNHIYTPNTIKMFAALTESYMRMA